MKKLISASLLLFALAMLFLTGCKLDKPILPSRADTTGGITVFPPTSSNSYLPVTKGTTWTYVVSAGGSIIDTTTTTITGNTMLINGLTYDEATSVSKASATTQTGYFYAANHIYRQRQEVEGNILDLYELNDTTAKGHSWTVPVTDNGQVNGVPGQLIGTIVQKGITKTVLGKTFTDVIEVELNIQYDYGLGNGFETDQTSDLYFAKGIGVIESDSILFGILVSSTQLVSYTIK